MPLDPSQRIVVIYEGPKVGVDPDIAGEVVRAIIMEAARQGGRGRFHVVTLTLGRSIILLRLQLSEDQLRNEKQYLAEAKAVFGGVAANVYMNRRMGIRG